jgi:RNA polymerase sigma-70 factor (ECF subfamily)
LDWKAAAKRKAEVVSLSDEMALCIPDQRKEAEVEAKEIGRAMNVFLENISQESRVIFLRRYWFCDTIAEIAERYGISESKVKMRLLRTRKQLSEFLNREGIAV